MADKHIKDGIDVGQCKYYSIEHDDCARTLSGSCMKEKCQTFRLLQTIKAKEQECNQLKAENDLFRTYHDNEQAKRIKFEQAIEEIENIIGKYKLSETIIKLKRIDPIDVQEILNIVIKVRKNECEGKHLAEVYR